MAEAGTLTGAEHTVRVGRSNARRSWRGRRVALVVLLIAVVAGCNGWPSYRGDPGQTGFNSTESVLNTTNVSTLALRATGRAGGYIVGAPVVVDDLVYVTTLSKTLEAFDANLTTGCASRLECPPLWRAELPTDTSAAATVSGGFVYVVTPDRGSSNGRLLAFKAGNGADCTAVVGQVTRICSPVWQAAASSEYGPPTVANGVVYVAHNGTLPGTAPSTLTPPALLAFDAAGSTNCGGAPRTCAPIWTAPSNAIMSPAVAGGRAYTVNVSTGVVSAFDAAGSTGCTGTPKVCTPLFTSAAAPNNDPSVNVVVVDGTAFRAQTGTVTAFDADGAESCGGSPVVCQPLWTAANGGGQMNLIAVAYGDVYVSAGSQVWVYDAAGVASCGGAPKTCSPRRKVSWDPGISQSEMPWATSSLIIANGVGYVAIGNGTGFPALLAFDARSMNGCTADAIPICPLLAKHQVDSDVDVAMTPAVQGGRAYVGTTDGHLYLLELPS